MESRGKGSGNVWDGGVKFEGSGIKGVGVHGSQMMGWWVQGVVESRTGEVEVLVGSRGRGQESGGVKGWLDQGGGR